MSASNCYALLLWKTLVFNMFGYNEALEALSKCSSDSCLRQDLEIPQPSSTCYRSDISPSSVAACQLSCAFRLDSANRWGSNRPILCKQECSLRKVFAFVGMQCRSRSCSSFCFQQLMFCC
jgi:hypothetical protein